MPFNLYETPIGTQSYSSARPLHHLVKADGSINFPVIGKFQVAGLTTNELTTKLASVLEVFIKKPVINIQLLNFKVTVLGEVNKPVSYAVANGRITILEAIGLAGDLTIYGKRKTVSLIREKEGKRTFVTIDLTNKALFNSPYYYLAQNDVIYVEPNKAKINGSAVGANSGVIVSSISILISIIAILLK